ncbi:MAG: hypothetical protein AABW99_04220 [archaeon]
MGILKWLFGLFSAKSSKVGIEEAEKIASAELEKGEKELVDFSFRKFAEIKHLVSELSKSAAMLNEKQINVDEGNKRFRLIVATSQKNLARQLSGLSSKLAPPSNPDVQKIREYSARASDSVARDLLPYWKNIALAKLMLQDEVRAVGENLKELSQAFEDLRARAFSKKNSDLSYLKNFAESFRTLGEKSLELEKESSEKKRALDSSKRRVAGLGDSLGEMKGSQKALKVKEFEDRKARYEGMKEETVSSMNSEIASLEKILKRLYSLSESSALLSEKEKEVLKKLLDAPFSAVVSDPSGMASKSVLSKAKKLVEEGSISVKDSEKGKRLASISALLEKDFFQDYFWKLNKIQVEIVSSEKELSKLDIYSELKQLEGEISSEKAALSEAAKELGSAEASLADAKARAAAQKENFVKAFNAFFVNRFEIKS